MMCGGTPISYRKGVEPMQVTYETIEVMIAFASLVVTVISVIVAIKKD